MKKRTYVLSEEQKEIIKKIISELVVIEGSITRLAAKLDVCENTVRSWRKKGSLIELMIVAKINKFYGIDIYDLRPDYPR